MTMRSGRAFPDMSDAYSAECRAIAKQVAAELGIDLGEGVYAAMLGPSYETPAEIRFLRTIGADLVGHVHRARKSSSANHMGIRLRGDLVRDEYGGGHPAAEDQSRGGAGDGRAGSRHAGAAS